MRQRVAVLVACATVASVGLLNSGGLLGLASGRAGALIDPTNIPGNVTCTPSGGVWSGLILFSPPLMNGGTASTETMIVKAGLGNTASPCHVNTGIVALGEIVGKITFHISGSANNCATIFSGSVLPAPTGKFKLVWTTPGGANPTKWTQPSAFKVTGAAGLSYINITHGTVTGSFSPLAVPKAQLSDANWPGATGAVATGCASTGGLASLTLSTSKGKW